MDYLKLCQMVYVKCNCYFTIFCISSSTDINRCLVILFQLQGFTGKCDIHCIEYSTRITYKQKFLFIQLHLPETKILIMIKIVY